MAAFPEPRHPGWRRGLDQTDSRNRAPAGAAHSHGSSPVDRCVSSYLPGANARRVLPRPSTCNILQHPSRPVAGWALPGRLGQDRQRIGAVSAHARGAGVGDHPRHRKGLCAVRFAGWRMVKVRLRSGRADQRGPGGRQFSAHHRTGRRAGRWRESLSPHRSARHCHRSACR